MASRIPGLVRPLADVAERHAWTKCDATCAGDRRDLALGSDEHGTVVGPDRGSGLRDEMLAVGCVAWFGTSPADPNASSGGRGRGNGVDEDESQLKPLGKLGGEGHDRAGVR
jgi:hypothetical protein